jgi:3D (Asp-Asp-Asp) domain-containing protein
VRSGEWILQEHSSRNIRKNRSQIHKENRLEQRAWKSASRYQYQKYLEEHPEMQKKLIRKLIQKQRIKREYQMAYRAGKIAKETKDTSIRSVNLATKIARKAQEVFVRNVTTLISMGLLLILLLSVMTGFASCSAMFSNGISTVIASSYIADPDEIEKAELYYTQLEASLQQKINQMEARYPGKDEYRYNIGEIGHDPHTLISYLTARYGDFKFDEIKGELETIFSLQYGITVEEKSETRQETSTIQVGQSLGNVVTSGYCNCPICCGVWSGGPTASGAMPQANHTLAVDAANPFLPMGTKVVMNGIEYTVEDTGNFAQYGVQFDVYYDNHAVAEAHGHQTWECFLAEGNQNSVEVTRTVTADVLNVSVQAKPLRSVILSRMEEDEQEIYEEVYSNRGNLQTYKTPVELNWYAYIRVFCKQWNRADTTSQRCDG